MHTPRAHFRKGTLILKSKTPLLRLFIIPRPLSPSPWCPWCLRWQWRWQQPLGLGSGSGCLCWVGLEGAPAPPQACPTPSPCSPAAHWWDLTGSSGGSGSSSWSRDPVLHQTSVCINQYKSSPGAGLFQMISWPGGLGAGRGASVCVCVCWVGRGMYF